MKQAHDRRNVRQTEQEEARRAHVAKLRMHLQELHQDTRVECSCLLVTRLTLDPYTGKRATVPSQTVSRRSASRPPRPRPCSTVLPASRLMRPSYGRSRTGVSKRTREATQPERRFHVVPLDVPYMFLSPLLAQDPTQTTNVERFVCSGEVTAKRQCCKHVRADPLRSAPRDCLAALLGFDVCLRNLRLRKHALLEPRKAREVTLHEPP